MPEPLEITVESYRIEITLLGSIKLRLKGLSGEVTLVRQEPTHGFVTALARELVQSRASLTEIHGLATELSQADYGYLGRPGPDFAKIATIAARQPAREEA